MEFKRFLINKLVLFFMLSTLITIAVYLIGSAFDSEARFGYDALLTPIKYAALCLLPTLVMWSQHELSPKQILVRKALMLVLLEAVILFIAFTSPVIDTGSDKVILTLVGSVLVIFVLVNLFLWLQGSAEAKKLSRDLAAFQKLHEAP
ncbi:MAG: hypothetical protein J6T99_03255 [Oscillospiraceae bacterium]|nr:hypothetical protein [Oscillospiraceae bacterium]MBO7727260.1 hypothetical protein [Oscillospiraceae bacterium]